MRSMKPNELLWAWRLAVLLMLASMASGLASVVFLMYALLWDWTWTWFWASHACFWLCLAGSVVVVRCCGIAKTGRAK